MVKCDIPGCNTELEKFNAMRTRKDGIIIEVLSTNRLYLICKECAIKYGLINHEKR